MFLPRIIPVLLLKGKGLVKTIKFSNPKYIGDPINAVRIFNDLKADELIFLDIDASKENRTITWDLVEKIGDEAFMPFGVGGGIKTIQDAEKILKAGAEKIILSTQAALQPELVKEMAQAFGSQSIVISIDIKKNIFGKKHVWIKDGTYNTSLDPVVYAKRVEDLGAGEIIIHSIDLDGAMKGYDLELIKCVTENMQIPVIACGGASSLYDIKKVCVEAGAHAAAAGSLFVYHGARKAVLINYPSKEEVSKVFDN